MEYFKQLVGSTFDEGQFPFVPEGQALDMGQDSDGRPLFDPRILDSAEFFRNPYPYYRILRDHYPVFRTRTGRVWSSGTAYRAGHTRYMGYP